MGNLCTYNAEIMAIGCDDCGAGPKQRCHGRNGNGPAMSHKSRQHDAGYNWNWKTKQLEKHVEAQDDC